MNNTKNDNYEVVHERELRKQIEDETERLVSNRDVEPSLPASAYSAVSAVLSPSNAHKSRRGEQLSQDARDLLSYAFAAGLPVSDLLPIPMTAAEVMIGPGDVDRIMMGGGFHRHGGSDSLRYFNHVDDEQWALIFAHDCDGCSKRGAKLVATYSPNRANMRQRRQTE